MEQSTNPPPSNSSPNYTWLYILGGCCCFFVIFVIVVVAIAITYFGINASSVTSDLENFQSDISNEFSDNTSSNYQDDSSQYSDTYIDNNTGTIEGSLSYPGESIPSDLQVCAENIFYNDQIYCADQIINDSKYTNSTGYTIEAPVGSYYVYSYIPSAPDNKAYYTEFVECGLSVDCTSHDKLIIDVYPDETTDKVDPIDWYQS